MLAAEGFAVVGIDTSETLLAKASATAGGMRAHRQPVFELLDLREIARRFAGQVFDSIVCLGNTLPHVASQAEVASFLEGCHKLLRPGGLLTLQLIDYAGRIDGEVWSMPPVPVGAYLLERKNEMRDGHVSFELSLASCDSAERTRTMQVLLPLHRADVEAAAIAVGFELSWRLRSFTDGSGPNAGESYVVQFAR